MFLKKKGSSMEEPSLTKKSSLMKRASLKRKASLRKNELLTKEASLTNDTSLTKQTSLAKATSLSNRTPLSKDTSLETTETSFTNGMPSTKEMSLTKNTSLTKDASVSLAESSETRINATPETFWFKRFSFVTVRNDEEGWFLGRLKTNVYNTTKKAKIHWLSKLSDDDDEVCYEWSYHDVIDPACILCEVSVLRHEGVYTLEESDRLQSDHLLNLIQYVESGDLTASDLDSDIEEVIQIDPPPKKRKRDREKRETNVKGKKIKKTSWERKRREANNKPEKVKKVPKTRKKMDDNVLHPNPDVKIYEKDPTFEDNTPVPYFVSKYAHSRLIFRAVKRRDHALLKKLLKSVGKIRHVNNWRSVADQRTPFQYAMAVGDKVAMKILSDDFLKTVDLVYEKDERMNVPPDKINVSKLGTGSSSSSSHTGRLMASRGSREGNNALIKDVQDMLKEKATDEPDSYMAQDRKLNMDEALRIGIDFDIFQEYFICGDEDNMDIYENMYNNFIGDVDEALIRGHFQLAGQFMKDVISQSSTRWKNLLTLHYTVLTSDSELKNAPPSQVTATMKQCKMITPVHCAACNPDTQYLEKLLKVEPDVHVSDRQNRRPIHFAAGCQGTGPLELLISSKHNANIYDSDRKGNMALYYAVQAGRLNNVKILLQAGAENNGGDDPFAGSYGVAGINRPNKKSYTPLHLACKDRHLDFVKLLVEKGADVNAALNTSNFKLTPLIVAAQFGSFDVVVYLVKNEAEVQKRDRLGRSAVIHAAMNGNTNVLSYLLNIGANPNQCDNSGNSPLHYAAAYGWFFCVQSLLQAGADVNVGNNWKTTPLSIAYLKGHIGIVSYLLTNDHVDVNFVDDDGMTLLFTAASSALEPDLYNQIEDLVQKGGNCSVIDLAGDTPLHYLASNDILLDGTERMRRPSEDAMDTSVKIAKLLLKHGCNGRRVNKQWSSAAMAAMRSGNLKLFKLLIEGGCPVLTDLDDEGFNILHHLSNEHMESLKGFVDILKFAVKQDGKKGTQNIKKQLCTMAQEYCHLGYTPLLLACSKYAYCETRFQDNWRWSEEDQQAVRDLWKQGREFINLLIAECSSDINAKVREIHFGEGMEKPRQERDRYDDHSIAEWTATDILLSIKKSEYGEDKIDPEPECPALKKLLKYKPDLNTRDTQGHTTLSRQVAWKETIPKAKVLIKESNVDVNSCQYKTVDSKQIQIWAFTSAALQLEKELLKLMIERGADVNIKNTDDGITALHAVVGFFHTREQDSVVVEIVETLIENGAEVNAANYKGRTPLHLAVNQLKGGLDDNYDVLLTLINNGASLTAEDKFGRIPLHFSFVKPDTKKMNTSEWLPSCNGFQSEHDPVELVRILVSRMKKEDVNTQDNYGMSILHHAAFRGAHFCCLFLLQIGADMTLKDNDGNTALTMALKGRHDGCAAALIQYGARLTDPIVDPENTTSEDDLENPEDDTTPEAAWKWIPQKPLKPPNEIESMSIFEFAIKYDLQGVCFLLMERPHHESGVTFDEAVESGIRQHKYNVVLRLMSTTADVSSLQEDREHGRNVLHILSLNDFAPCRRLKWELIEKVVNELMSRGVSLSKQDDYKCTPLHYASLNHHYQLGAIYLKAKKSYNAKHKDIFNRSVLSASFWNGRDSLDADLTWWVHDLCQKGGNINELIDRPIPECVLGEDIQRTLTDPDYWKSYNTVKISPLIFSIAHNSVYFTQWVLKFGANINLADSSGQSPLMHAVKGNNLDMVKTILNNNFEPGQDGDDEEEETAKKKKVKRPVFTLKRKASVMSNSGGDEDEEDEEDEIIEDEEEEEVEEKKYQPFKKTSKVNLNAADKNGWTVIHHAVCPLSFGTFDNDEIVFILAKAGARLNVKNKKGDTPLDLALRNGAFKIARMIQELVGVPEKNRRVPEVTYEYPHVTDNLKWTKSKPLFTEDAEKYIVRHGSAMDVDDKVVAIIDEECEVKNGSLVNDEVEDVLYDVLLMKVDINRDLWSIFNFYLMQLIYQPGKDMYVLFTKWGVIGESGKFQHTPFHTKEEGVGEFCKIFESKTGNKWINVKSFEKKPGKYQLIPTNERHNPPAKNDFEFELKSSMKSKLPQYLQDIMKVLMNMEEHKYYTSRSNMDLNVLPLSRLKRERLAEASQILDEVSTLMKTIDHYRANATQNDGVSNTSEQEDKLKELKEDYILALEKIVVLSSRYYQVIPQKEFNASKTRLLENASSVTKQTRLVNHLLDSITARDLLLGAKFHENGKCFIHDTNPLDHVYQSLGCQIQPAEEDDQDSQYLLRHIVIPKPDTGIRCIYRLQREGERNRIDKRNLGNRHLLWLNIRPTNLANLFYSGATPAPITLENTAFTGDMGITFYESFFDVMTNSRDDTYAVLCEVALGKTQTVYKPDQKKGQGYDSAYLVGFNRRDDKYDVQLNTGCKLSFGEVKREYVHKGENLRQPKSMYIVYDSSQVCLRYLIKYSG